MSTNGSYQQLLLEAQQFIDNKKYSSAIASYEKALLLEPNDKILFYNLGWTYNESGDLKKAKDYYQKAISADAAYANAYNGLGSVYLDSNERDKAIEQYQLALKYEPHHSYALRNLGLVYRQSGDFDKAINYYKEAAAADEKYTGKAHYSIGEIYLDELGNYDKAIDEFLLSLNYNPDDKFTLYNLGRAYRKKEELDKAIEFYNESIEVDPKYADAYNGLGTVYSAKRDFNKAKEFYEKSIDLEADNKYALYNLADSYKNLGELDKAIDFYQKAIETDGNYADAYQALGTVYEQKKDFNKAIEFYQKALEFDPNHEFALYGLGNYYAQTGELEKSIDYYNKAIAANSKYADAYVGLGATFDEMKDTGNATLAYENALSIDPYNKYALNNLGILYQRNGETYKAVAYYQQAIEADHNYADPHYALGCIYLDQLNYSDALDSFEQALRIDENYVYAYHNTAWVYEKLGQFKKSKDEWSKANALYYQLSKKDLTKKDADKYFYYAQIMDAYVAEIDPKYNRSDIRTFYKKAIDLDEENSYFRHSFLKFLNEEKMDLARKKQQLNISDRNQQQKIIQEVKKLLDDDPEMSMEQKIKKEQSMIEERIQERINKNHVKVLFHYRTGVESLKKKLEKQKNTYDLVELGEFYLLMGEYAEASKVYQEAIGLDEYFGRGYVGLGVAQSKLDNFDDAIRNFKKAILFDPDDLNLQSNLADAYLKSDRLALAEECYKRILNIAPCHVDAMIGLAEHHKLMADKMSDDKKYSDAEEFFVQAAKLYDEILNKAKDFKSISRKLNSQEISSVNYSVGYIKVKLYEINEGLGFRALTKFGKSSDLEFALKSFKQITLDQPEFYKAQTAIKKIKKQFSVTASVRRKIAPSMVFLLSLLICLAAQFFFWLGRPTRKDRFLVNSANLSGFISQNQLDFFTGGLHQVATKKFNSLKDLQDDVKKTISGSDSVMQKLANLPTIQVSEVEFEPIDSTIYISLTFGTLIFMVVGLYLGNISKLKVGAIELEKTTSDTISTSSSLGIPDAGTSISQSSGTFRVP